MRPKIKTAAASFMILVLLLMPSKLWAQDPPKKTESPPADCAKVVIKETWLTCYWSSKDKKGNPRPATNRAGRVACAEATNMHILWENADVAKESQQAVFLKYVGADRLPDPFADRLIVQRFFEIEGRPPFPSTEFITLAADEDPVSARKKFRDYMERTATPPTFVTTAVTEWSPPPAAETRVETPTQRATQPSERVATVNQNK